MGEVDRPLARLVSAARHAVHVIVLAVLVSAAVTLLAVALVIPIIPDAPTPPAPVVATTSSTATTTTTAAPVTVAPGSLTEANDLGDPTFIPEKTRDQATTSPHTTPPTTTAPSTTAAPATSTTGARTPDTGHGWTATGETRRTDSTVYCVSGVTYSGGQTHAEGEGVGRTVAVNRDNGEWERYVGTSWRVVDGPHAGAIYTVEDAGTRAHFDMWHGDRGDCRDYALGTYGVIAITVERVHYVPA